LFPNPADHAATLFFQANRSGLVRINVENSLGQKVYTAQQNVEPNWKYSILIDCSTWSPGIYSVRLSGEEDGEHRILFVVQ
jgi:hypothetical protein